MRNRAVSTCLALSGDSNLKLCLVGLDCLQTLIENQTDSFQPYLNMTLKLLIQKFSDTQVSSVNQIKQKFLSEMVLCSFSQCLQHYSRLEYKETFSFHMWPVLTWDLFYYSTHVLAAFHCSPCQTLQSIDVFWNRFPLYSQPTVLARASEVMVSVINVLGLSEGFETLTVRHIAPVFMV